jgi:hypothetical protein
MTFAQIDIQGTIVPSLFCFNCKEITGVPMNWKFSHYFNRLA